jgi:hypothetical protein
VDKQTAQLIAAIRLSPPGTFKLFRATEHQPEVEQSMANRSELAARIKHAREADCFIEVISLRIQYIDLWLRVFYENPPHREPRKREFGRLLKQCLKQGLEKTLYDRIHTFNGDRVKAIHGYLIGLTAYDELRGVVEKSEGLSEALAESVVLNCGETVTDQFEHQHHNRGDSVYHIPSLLTKLRSGTLL